MAPHDPLLPAPPRLIAPENRIGAPVAALLGRLRERAAFAGRPAAGTIRRRVRLSWNCDAVAAELAERARGDDEIASLRQAVAPLDDAVLAGCGGLNGAVARCAALETAATAASRVKPMITCGRTWRSRRVPG